MIDESTAKMLFEKAKAAHFLLLAQRNGSRISE
jgi:hypothetical protein